MGAREKINKYLSVQLASAEFFWLSFMSVIPSFS